MFHSIRFRIAFPFLVLILGLTAGLAIYITRFVEQTYTKNLEKELLSEARLIGQNLGPRLAAGISPSDLNETTHVTASLIGKRITLIAKDGTVIAESHDNWQEMENHLDRPEISQAIESGQGSSRRYSFTVGYQMMYLAVPVKEDGDLLGIVRVGIPLEQIDRDLGHIQRVTLGAALLATLLAFLLAVLIANRTTRPLRDLTQAAHQLAGGDLQGHILPTSQDEVGQLTQAFNLMGVQLRAQIEALEAERSRIAAVLGEMTDGVLIVDQQGRVQLMNPAAENMFELDARQGMGRSLVEIVRHHRLVELWQSCKESGDTQSATFDLPSKQLYLQVVATPLGQSLPGSILLLFQNLTRIRKLETIRRDFISNISHELRTPLASLKALTETLQESALDDPPAAHRFLQRMETEVDSLSLMVQELLELARIESGQVPIQLTLLQPEELIEQSVDRLKLQAERAGLAVNVELSDHLPAILADKNRLEQVLVNLLHNAIKFTPVGGTITVRADHQEDQVFFSVEDNGLGIPTADLPRIFERFYKADRARSGGGTGLGLAISRHLVEAHHGKIWVESQEGKGSKFYFSIPTAIAP